MRADWDGEASKAGALASKEEEEVLERRSLDFGRHSMNGTREPLLASTGSEGQHCCSRLEAGSEEQAETCRRIGAVPDAAIILVAKCGAAPDQVEP